MFCRRQPLRMLALLLALLPAPTSRALTNGLALTPPMGWNSWNNFGCSITEALIRSTTDAMATNGMKAAGYQFINIDDCWQTSRDSWGVIVADPVKFPSGIKALADYIHAKGLKLGVYSDHGLTTCGGRPGGYGYEYLDASTYAAWGVDYLKYDNCNLPAGDSPQADYFRMADGLMKSGRPITFSICAWSFASWDPDLGNLWRTTGDISDSYASMISKLGDNSKPAYLAGPGRWNDPDMLEVGRGGMTATEDQSHFTLWCMMAAPLIAGNNLSSMSAQTLATLTNPEVIAVDQDPAGEQGFQVAGTSTNQIWCKPLGSDFTTKAVALFNNGTNAAAITANWTNLGLQAGPATVRDLWARSNLGTFTNSFTTNVPAHGVVLLRVVGASPALPIFGTNYLSDLQPAYAYVGWGTMTKDKSIGGNTLKLNGTSYAKGLGAHAFSGLEYRLGAIASRFQADIGVDDESGANGSIVFQVFADGTKIYDSGVLTGGAAHQTLNLDLTGVNRLTLGVADANDGINSDHADWAGARIIVTNTVPAPPPAPTGLAASPGNPIALGWNVMRSATSYNVKRSMTANGSYTNLANLPVPGFSDTNVVAGTTYYYEVSSVSSVGESSNSAPASATACSPPAAPLGLSAVASDSQIALTWNVSAGATSYSVARSTSSSAYAYVAIGLTSAAYIDTNVAGGTIYSYSVAAANACNQGLFSAPVSTALPPSVPTGLTATPGNGEVVLMWNASSSPMGFVIKRSTTNGGPYYLVASNITTTSYLDTGLVNGVAFYYVIAAVLAGSQSSNSAQATATPCSGSLPAGWSDQDIGSVGFAGSASSCSNTFTLQGGGADIWGTADAFNFAAASLAGDRTVLARVTSVQNTDPWAKAGVMFRNDTGAGAMFADVFVSPGNGVNFQWRTATGGQCGSTGVGGLVAPVWVKMTRSGTNFSAYYGTDGIGWTLLGTTGIPMAGTALGGLEVTAHNNSALCLALFDNLATAAPATPSGLSAAAGDARVTLKWTDSPMATSYHVKRARTSGGPYATVASPTVASYTDVAVTNWAAWYYVVSAVNGVGESGNSSEASAVPRPRPPLNASPSGNQLFLSWPGWATGYTAYSASNLLAPIQWQTVTNSPQSNNGWFNLTLPKTQDQRFFRLGAP